MHAYLGRRGVKKPLMKTLDVSIQSALCGSSVVTVRTSKRFFSSMSPHVVVQILLGLKKFTTFVTFVVSYSKMPDFNMSSHFMFLLGLVWTIWTFPFPIFRSSCKMNGLQDHLHIHRIPEYIQLIQLSSVFFSLH